MCSKLTLIINPWGLHLIPGTRYLITVLEKQAICYLNCRVVIMSPKVRPYFYLSAETYVTNILIYYIIFIYLFQTDKC